MSAHRFAELKAKFVVVCQRFENAETIEEKWSLLPEGNAILAEVRSLLVEMRRTTLNGNQRQIASRLRKKSEIL
jgi:hypothetical protein